MIVSNPLISALFALTNSRFTRLTLSALVARNRFRSLNPLLNWRRKLRNSLTCPFLFLITNERQPRICYTEGGRKSLTGKGLADETQSRAIPAGTQSGQVPAALRQRGAMRAGRLQGPLAGRLPLPGVRLPPALPHPLPQALAVPCLPPPELPRGRHDLRRHQAAADRLVPGAPPADAGQARRFVAGTGAAAGRQPEHGLEDEAQALASDEGARRAPAAGRHRAGGRRLLGRGAERRPARARRRSWPPCRSPPPASRQGCA